MQMTADEQLIVHALFAHQRQGVPVSPGQLAAITLIDPESMEATLQGLDAAGLVDLSSLRLTLPGLAMAAALRARSRGRRRLPLSIADGSRSRWRAA